MYDAGQAVIQIIPSLRGFVESINREAEKAGMSAGRVFSDQFNRQVRSGTNNANLGPSTQVTARQGQQTGRTFADSFKARVEAALRSLPDVQINADSTAAEVRIARLRTNLEQLRDQRVGIDIDAATAMASVENIKRQLDELRASSPDVAVQVDTLHASEELARIQAEITALRGESADVSVNVSDNGTADATSRSVSALGIAMVGLLPLAAPVGAALAGAFAGALSIAGVLGAAVGTIGLGLSDVPKATQLLGQRQTARQSAQTGAASNAQAVSAAQQSLGDARRQAGRTSQSDAQAVADARRSAARQEVADAQAVAAAERDLRQADQSVTVAQQGLNAAREQAARDLVDLRNKAIDAQLAQKQSDLDLADAKANLAAVDANWTSTAEQRKQAQLDVAKAQQAVTEAHVNSKRATEDSNKAQKAGVNGAPGVVAAQRQLTSAVRQQQDAVRSLHRAQVQQQQDAADSARAIARAEEKQRQDAADSARSIARAQQAVALAMQRTGSQSIDSLANTNAELAKLPPAVVQFAKFWRSHMSPILDQLKNKAASGLFPGIERGLKIMKPLFGPLGDFLHTMGQTVGKLFTQMARALTGPEWTRLFKLFSAEAPKWLMQFGHIVGNSITGIVELLQGFAPVTTMIGNGLVKITRGFADWASTLGKNKGFQSFIAYIKQNGPILVDALGKIFTIIGKLAVGLAPLGSVMLKVIDVIAGFLSTLSPNELVAIAGAIGGIAVAFKLWRIETLTLSTAMKGMPWVALAAAAVAVAALIIKNWGPISRFFKRIWDDVVGFFERAWADIKQWFLDAWNWVKNTFSSTWHGLVSVVTTPFETAWRWIKRYFWDPVKNAFISAWHWVRDTFTAIWHGIYAVLVHPFEVVWSWLGQHFWTPVKNAFLDAWHWVSNTFSSIWHGINAVLRAPIDAFSSVVSTLWDGIKRGFTAGINGVKTAAKTAWGFIEKIFESPVYYVVKYAYQDGIRALWDATAGKIGLPPMKDLSGFLGHLKHFASGGIFPGYTPGRDTGLIAVGGGEAIMRPEWTRAVGADYVESANDAARRGGVHGVHRFLGGYASGGVAPLPPGVLKTLAGVGASLNLEGMTLSPLKDFSPIALGSSTIDWVKSHWAALTHTIDNLIHKIGDSSLGKAMVKLPVTLAEKIPGFIIDKLKSAASSLDHLKIGPETGSQLAALLGGSHAGGPRAVWKALTLGGLPPVQAAGVMGNIQSESGFNPFIIQGGALSTNPADAGGGGYGLVQWTPGSKLVPYLHGQTVSVASEVAALLNQLAGRGPSPELAAGRALMAATSPAAAATAFGLGYERYAGGVQTNRASQAEFWYNQFAGGPTAYDQGGLLQPGLTLAYNGTGQAELVAPKQTFDQVMGGGGKGGRVTGTLDIGADSQGRLYAEIDARIDDRAGFADSIGRAG